MAPAEPPRIVFVVARLDRGGSERQMLALILKTHPNRLRCEVATLYPHASAEMAAALAKTGVPVHVLTSGRGPRPALLALARARLRGLLHSRSPAAVYAWLEEASLVTSGAARAAGIPFVAARRNVCGSSLERFGPARRAIRGAEARATIVTGNSEAVIENAVERGVEPTRLRLAPNGHESAPPLPPPDNQEVRLGYVAQLRREKGHSRLLDALMRLDARAPWRADLAGGGPLAEEVRNAVAERALTSRVELVGPISHPRAFWAERDIAVLLSDYEGSPNALIEAGMAGRPMIATNSGGTAGVVCRGCGFLVALDDAQGAADALTRLIDDRELRLRMGAAAHQHVTTSFSTEAFVRAHLAALADAIGGGRVSDY